MLWHSTLSLCRRLHACCWLLDTPLAVSHVGCTPSHGSHVLQVVSATITVTLRARVLRFDFDGLSGAVRIAGDYAIPPACCCCCFAMARCCSLHASCPLPCVPCVPACVLNPGAPVCHPHRKQTGAACGRSLLMWRPGSASWCTAAGGDESGRKLLAMGTACLSCHSHCLLCNRAWWQGSRGMLLHWFVATQPAIQTSLCACRPVTKASRCVISRPASLQRGHGGTGGPPAARACRAAHPGALACRPTCDFAGWVRLSLRVMQRPSGTAMLQAEWLSRLRCLLGVEACLLSR